MLESALEAYLRVAVRARGGMSIKLSPIIAGTPDRLVILGGFYLVELKTLTGRLSAVQVEWHRRAAEIGAEVTVLHGREEIDEWLRGVMPDAQ